jgi:hypothetical protein
MADRIVVLRPEDPVAFVADACAALADTVNQVPPWQPSDADLVDAYAAMLVAYARVMRPSLEMDPRSSARLAIIDHLLGRLTQAQAGEIGYRTADVADRLHAELVHEPTPV